MFNRTESKDNPSVMKSPSMTGLSTEPKKAIQQSKQNIEKGCVAVKDCLVDMATMGAAGGGAIAFPVSLWVLYGAPYCLDTKNCAVGVLSRIAYILACIAICPTVTACAGTASTLGLFASPCVALGGEPDCLNSLANSTRVFFGNKLIPRGILYGGYPG